MSGYWAQSVLVEPGKKYLFRGYLSPDGREDALATPMRELPAGRAERRRGLALLSRHDARALARPRLPAPDSLGGQTRISGTPSVWSRRSRLMQGGFASAWGLFFEAGEVWFDDLHAGWRRPSSRFR